MRAALAIVAGSAWAPLTVFIVNAVGPFAPVALALCFAAFLAGIWYTFTYEDRKDAREERELLRRLTEQCSRR